MISLSSYFCPACFLAHSLGENDCDGFLIGWIDESGTPFISRLERDIVVGSGALREALIAWSRSGGLLFDLQDPLDIMEQNNILLENQREVIDEFNSDLNLIMPLHQARASKAVLLN